MSKAVKSYKSSFFFKAGFFAFSSAVVLLIALQTSSTTKSYDLRSKAASAPAPVISNLKAYTTTDRATAYVTWTTNVPTTSFVAYDNSDLKMFGNDPLGWGSHGWRVNVDNTKPADMKLVHNVRIGGLNDLNADYFFRVAGKDYPATGRLAISVAPVLLNRPNCCGYNKAVSQWYCYTACKGYQPSNTTISPNKVCQTSAQCTK